MIEKPQALLLSGYHALSQQAWADYLVHSCTRYDWQTIALPARYFSWRMRGAPLSLSAQDDPLLHQSYRLLVATSSIDLAVVQSIYPALRQVPSILYFHENQFAYPTDNQPKAVIDWQMVNLYAALRADALVFNSDYNRQSFLTGVAALLKKLPDLVPKHLCAGLAHKAQVLPVAIAAPLSDQSCTPVRATWRLLWNHRWEWDKGPELLLAIVTELVVQDFPFKLILTGQQFRTIPVALREVCERFPDHLEQSGYVESRQDYRALLQHCDIVLSTAIHEFQGIAIMEAVSHGCIPLLPDRLSYPEFFAPYYLYQHSASIAQQATSAVTRLQAWRAQGLPEVPDLSDFYEARLVDRYQHCFSAERVAVRPA
ncbi:DUF3524 domain-containing protein [Reinekea sp.]|jgi:glycosyltransferase involved in cell wall biosynthesis|uniref:tRNA-queuosine alpha-mannosyltransferase domain-containing protein n=1 Tax=Reinekea sp. TaxID=1970455 RepID=UPI002A824574|nr:DUF3524 domain-containing protein [Reinekea sp.]